MKKEDLVKSLVSIKNLMTSARMSFRDNPKSYGDMRKLKYENALVSSLLSVSSKK